MAFVVCWSTVSVGLDWLLEERELEVIEAIIKVSETRKPEL